MSALGAPALGINPSETVRRLSNVSRLKLGANQGHLAFAGWTARRLYNLFPE